MALPPDPQPASSLQGDPPQVTYSDPFTKAFALLEQIDQTNAAAARLRAQRRLTLHQVRAQLEALIMATEDISSQLDRAEADVAAEESVSGLERAHIADLRQQLNDALAQLNQANTSLTDAQSTVAAATQRVSNLASRLEQIEAAQQADTTA